MDPRETSLESSGKLGNKVYYYINGEKFSRAYFIPVQPGTPAQLAWWLVFRNGVTAWQSLTAVQKETWNKKAKRHHFSGFNLFMRDHLNSA